MYQIINAKIITKETILIGYDLIIEADRIRQIAPRYELNIPTSCQIIDAKGGYILPGFIDIHSDYIEHMASPRPTSLMDFELSIRECEKHLISHGVTTIFHSLSLYKTSEFGENLIRKHENVRKFIEIIDQKPRNKHLIHHRFHARFEIDNLEQVENLKSYMLDEKVHLLSVMDHTPGQGQYRDLEEYKKSLKGYRNFSDEEITAIIGKSQKKEKMTNQAIQEIADLAHRKGIAFASHDDDSIEKLNLIEGLGATISEFPIYLEVAKEAKNRGIFTVAGAPNVLMGGSHNGNLSAQEAIAHQCIDILCSDYYPAALLHAIFILHDDLGHPLQEMVNLVTINPARAVHIDSEYGSIEEGKKADLLMVERLTDGFPVITSVFVEGQLVTQTNYCL